MSDIRCPACKAILNEADQRLASVSWRELCAAFAPVPCAAARSSRRTTDTMQAPGHSLIQYCLAG